MKIPDVLTSKRLESVNTVAIIRTQVRYSEKPKMVFLVTPPHLDEICQIDSYLVKQLG